MTPVTLFDASLLTPESRFCGSFFVLFLTFSLEWRESFFMVAFNLVLGVFPAHLHGVLCGEAGLCQGKKAGLAQFVLTILVKM